MANDNSDVQKSPGKGFLIASVLCALVFIANVIMGKFSVSNGATEASGVGDLGEFIILLIAVVLFIIACLARERAAKANLSRERAATADLAHESAAAAKLTEK